MTSLRCFLLVVCAVCFARTGFAETATLGEYGAMSWHWAVSPTNPDQIVVTLDARTGVDSRLQLSIGSPNAFPGDLVNGLGAVGSSTIIPNGVFYVRMIWYQIVAGDAFGPYGSVPQYKVTFAIPANATDHVIRYEVWQDGAFTGASATTSPGDPAHEQTFTGLTSNAVCTLREVTSNLEQGADGSWYFSSSTYVRIVNGGTDPVPDSSSNGAAGPVTSPTAPTSGPGNTAPAPSQTVNVTVNSPVWKPSSEVTGTGTAPGQSTSDMTVAAYREGVEKVVDATKQSTSSLAKAIDTNTNMTAGKLDMVSATLGNVNTSLGGVYDQLTTLNGSAATIANNTAGTKSSVDALKTAFDEAAAKPVKFVEDPAAYGVTWRNEQMTAAKNAAAAADLGYSGAKVDGNSVSVSGSSFDAGSGADVEVAGTTVSFSLSQSSTIDSILKAGRGLLLLAACVGFVYACSDTVNVYVAALGASGGSGSALAGIENAVPGVAQAKHLASAGAVSIAIMAAAAAIIAFVDVVATRYGIGLGSLLNAWDLGAIGPAYGFLDQYVPLAAITALSVLRAAFPYFVAPVYLAATTIARFAHV